ncbi:MAG: hypothetical protein J6A53_07640 [Clostridia bacterium]|nr:hypothetical protein [Clostridia bacterium]
MTENSVICKYICDHPNDWFESLHKDYGIRIKKEDSLAIFSYNVECDFREPIVQEARGIIIDYEKIEVVCWPFRKFGNYTESYADKIDWNNAVVLEKVDGSIIKLWYNHKEQKWQLSTNGMINADNATTDAYSNIFYGDIIRQANNYNDIPFDALDKDFTYIFELVSPQTRVVVRYDEISLYHLGTRNNTTGIEINIDIGIKKPKSYPINSLEDCIKAAVELNKDCQADDEISNEGFVVVDKNWNRVKVKSPDYIMMHRLKHNDGISKKDCVNTLLHIKGDIEKICKANPTLIHIFKYYDFRISELMYQSNQMASLARSLYKEYSNDRGAVARIIAKHKLAYVGFKALETDLTGEQILCTTPIEKLIKLIPDYEPEDLNTLFVNK